MLYSMLTFAPRLPDFEPRRVDRCGTDSRHRQLAVRQVAMSARATFVAF